MRCVACDKLLTEKENSRKSITTGKYLQLCDEDYEPIEQDVPTTTNETEVYDQGDLVSE